MALEEARVALAQDEIPVGAVVVAHGQVVGKGHNLTEALHDVTAHAEMQAITAAAETLGGKYLTGCTLYVTVEPCVMCAGAIGWSQLGRLVYGAGDEKRGFKKFGHNDIGAIKEGKERGVLATAKDSSAVYRMESRREPFPCFSPTRHATSGTKAMDIAVDSSIPSMKRLGNYTLSVATRPLALGAAVSPVRQDANLSISTTSLPMPSTKWVLRKPQPTSRMTTPTPPSSEHASMPKVLLKDFATSRALWRGC